VSGAADSARTLHERALALARVAAAPPESDTLELLAFRLASERYAIETRHVVEVHPLRDLTPLPGTPDFLRGIVNLRGRILPVFDLKKFFGLPEEGVTDLHRIIVVRGRDLELGLLADMVVNVISLSRSALQTGLPTLSGIGAEYIMGVSGQRVIALDLDRVLADPRIVVDDAPDG
jgi:purine-binding chemotaxis protein CheW